LTKSAEASTLLIQAFGIPLLAYLCASDKDSLRDRFRNGTPLGDTREELLTHLTSLANQLALESAEGRAPMQLLSADLLGRWEPLSGTTVANVLRLSAGGSIDLVAPASDDVAAILVTFLRDLYPLLLLPRMEPAWRPPLLELGGPFYRHPAQEQMGQTVLADPDLRRLFPRRIEGSGWVGATYRSTGVGGSLQLTSLPQLLITDAWWWCHLVEDPPSREQLVESIRETVSLLRRAVRGEPADVKALIGFTGVVFEEGASTVLPFGTLRAVSEQEKEIALPMLEGRYSSAGSDGESVTASYAGDLVLETRLAYRIRLRDPEDTTLGPWPEDLREQLDVLERKAETVRLAVLLTGEREPPLVVTSTWRAIQDPLTWAPLLSWPSGRGGPAIVPHGLSRTELDTLLAWIRRVNANRNSSVDVAVRRTLSATGARVDSADALVDLVIAWENLFGSRQGESILRISASLGWLLGRTAEEREMIRGAVAKLYGQRSDIVHGNRAVPPEETSEALSRARSITVSALRTLYERRSDLLMMRNSEDRSPETDPCWLGGSAAPRGPEGRLSCQLSQAL